MTEMQGNSAVHIAFNRSITSSLANRFYHLSGFCEAIFFFRKKSSDFPTSSICSQPRIFLCPPSVLQTDTQSIVLVRKCAASKNITVHWCLGREFLMGDWFLGSICFRVKALIQSHALLLFHSPIFGRLFLYQPLSG